ncbi:hypothetical protein ACEPAH_3050 [Sanghuangporus vaninii]
MLALSLISASLFFSAQSQSLPPGILQIQQAYTPQFTSCPQDFHLLRQAGPSPSQQLLGPDEAAYISARESSVLPDAWNTYLHNVLSTSTSTSNSSLPSYVSSILSSSSSSFPKLGIAVSGGGYRAAIFGAGVLNALDARNSSSSARGTGGLLQAATYLSSLSGGSWLISSLLQSNFPSFQSLIFGSGDTNPAGYGGWNTPFDILSPAGSSEAEQEKNLLYLEGIIAEITGKNAVGFPVTITDVWARLLARHFCNGTHASTFFDDTQSTHGAGILLSDIPNLPSFKNHQIPFPIITADSVSPNEDKNNVIPGDIVPLTNTIFEFTPFEMGSFDPTLSAFTPTKFLGTVNTSSCVTGFDQLAYIFGTSSQLFNELNTSAAALAASPIGPLFSLLAQALPQPASTELDLSLYPNAFFGVAPSTFPDSAQAFLGLVDGGEDGEVLPLQPLLVRARGVDTILAIDASADTGDNFAGGLALIATQNRTSLFPESYSFPPVPTTQSAFTSQGLTTRPTFFGCSSSPPTPLIIYLANGGPPSGEPPLTNTSTQQTAYADSEIQGMLDQSFRIATQGFPPPTNSTNSSSSSPLNLTVVDPDWPACLACAVVDRTRAKQGIQRSGLCESCFGRYCWSP